MKIKLTANDAQEVQHKMGVLADTEDLQADYGLTQAQADALRDSVPNAGEWAVPDWAIEAVKGELADHAKVLHHIANDARSGGDSAAGMRIDKQAYRIEGLAQ